MFQEQAEEQAIQAIITKRQEQEDRQKREEQEELLARELRRIKLEKLRDEKLRQQVRLESEEIRELEKKVIQFYIRSLISK